MDREIDVRDFIQRNYMPYEGDGSFLAVPPSAPRPVGRFSDLMAAERDEGRRPRRRPATPASITAHGPGYLDRDPS